MKALDAKVAEETGIRPGDRIRRVNGHPIEDELDYRFHAAGEEGATVEVQGCEGGDCRTLRLSREDVLGVDFVPMRSRRCRNRCLFCFVDQMPDGLRKSLYVKDEDYRFSFLCGNYVTLASVKDEELDRICRLKLQPLYVSVHATEQRVRNLLLGRKTSRHIMDTLRALAEGGITLHTQVVLCPGINDGSVLEKTLRDLESLYPAVASIAIVPVGLTRHRKRKGLWPIRSVRKNESKKLISKIDELQELFKVKYDDHLVFLADEFYRQADHPFPPADAYGDFPQWENGVGMVPFFYQQWERMKRRGTSWSKGGNGRIPHHNRGVCLPPGPSVRGVDGGRFRSGFAPRRGPESPVRQVCERDRPDCGARCHQAGEAPSRGRERSSRSGRDALPGGGPVPRWREHARN